MPDNKYGLIYTENDVLAILGYAVVQLASDIHDSPELVDEEVDKLYEEACKSSESGIRFKFPGDEPLFILRGRDKRSLGTVIHYRDHQSKRAPVNHLDAIDNAVTAFEKYRMDNPGDMKEPD